MAPPASGVGTVWDNQQHDAVPLSEPGRPEHPTTSSPSGGGAGSGSAIAGTFAIGLDMLGRSLDTVTKFSGGVRDRMTPAEMVRQISKGYALLSQGLRAGGGAGVSASGM